MLLSIIAAFGFQQRHKWLLITFQIPLALIFSARFGLEEWFYIIFEKIRLGMLLLSMGCVVGICYKVFRPIIVMDVSDMSF